MSSRFEDKLAIVQAGPILAERAATAVSWITRAFLPVDGRVTARRSSIAV